MDNWEIWAKALHIMSVIAWMAGLFYLPRLFVYHVDAPRGSVQSETFKVMERRLLKGIMNPALVAVWITGPAIAYGYGEWDEHWLHAKLLLVLAMTGFHGYLALAVKAFAADRNRHGSKFYRVLNELPTVLMALIVILVIVRPF